MGELRMWTSLVVVFLVPWLVALLTFLGSQGIADARVYFGGSCKHDIQWLVLRRGLCDKQGVNEGEGRGAVPYHQCTGWDDDDFWEGLDDAAAAAGHDDTAFADGADTMETVQALLIAASVLMVVAGPAILISTFVRKGMSWSTELTLQVILILHVVFDVPTAALTASAVALMLSTSQMSEDHWESATGCNVHVLWDGGMGCLVTALALLFVMGAYILFIPTPREHRHEPCCLRRVLALNIDEL